MEEEKMSKSNISRLAKSISSKRGLTQAEAERFISKMFEVANDGLQEDKLLKMKWLGTFKVTSVKDRESVDVNTGERIVIEGRDKISFTPDNILKEIVNKPFAQFETVVVNDGVDFSDIDEKFSLQDVPTEPIAAEMPNTISEQKTVEAHPSAEVQPIVENTTVESESLVNEDLLTKESSLVKNASDNEAATSNEAVASNNAAMNNDAVSSEETIISNGAVAEKRAELINETVTSKVDSHANLDSFASPDSPVNQDSPVKPVSPNNEESPVLSNHQTEEAGTSEPTAEVGEEEHSHHLMIPKYLVAIVCLAFVILLGGMGWFAFNFGKMQAQRDQLAMQLQTMKKPTQVATKDSTQTSAEDSAALALKKKAQEDSIRMAETSKAVEMAEKTEQDRVEGQASTNTSSSSAGESSSQGKGSSQAKGTAPSDSRSSSYDADPRVRTGAYRIVGVAQTVTVKDGQSLSSLSSQYLGPGMECYVEAVNGTTEVKVGQKIKIPKLELKRKKK